MNTSTATFPNQTWPRAEPDALGFDANALDAAGDRLDAMARDAGKPYRAMIVRRGMVAYERCSKDTDPDKQVRQASAAKSTYSCLLAIAVAEGRVKSFDDRVSDYYPAMLDVPDGKGPKPGRFAKDNDRDITFRQLISNTSGYMKPDEPPGEVFHYQSYGMNILCHAIAAAYGRYDPNDAPHCAGAGSLIDEKIRNPIGGTWQWTYTNFNLPEEARLNIFGNYTQLSMSIEDMARLGWLWINRGQWNGTQIIPADWLEQATRIASEVRDAKRHVGIEEMLWAAEYGYGFWANERGKLWPTLPRDAFAARGAGAKLIWCCPSLQLVAVLNPGIHQSPQDVEQGWLGDALAAMRER